MPWNEVQTMDERIRFVVEASSKAECFAVVCRKYGVSRKTGYKWLKRFQEVGLYGLRELSKAPRKCPHKTPVELREAIIALRKASPSQGPRKIVGELRRLGLKAPSLSTIANILKNAGLTKPRKRRNARFRQWPDKLTIPDYPNQVWTVDYKGWFRILDGTICYPLTVMDLYSRFLIGCRALSRPAFEPTWDSFNSIFTRFGLPEIIRVDNGAPFAGHGAGGISYLSALWLRLGIDVEFIDPGKPQQNGAHERMHRSLKQDIRKGKDMRQQQRRFCSWRRIYNHNREHEALGDRVPASLYTFSRHAYQPVIPDFSYGTEYEVRRVKLNGENRWRGISRYINQGLRSSSVGLLENKDGNVNVYAGSVFLGVLNKSGSGGLIRPPEPEGMR